MFIDPPADAEFISTSLYKSVPVQPIVPEGLMHYTKCSDQGLDFPPQFHQSILCVLRGIHHFDSCR